MARYRKYPYKVVREMSKERDADIYLEVSKRTGVPPEVVQAIIENGLKTMGEAMKQRLKGKDVIVEFPHIGAFYNTEEAYKKRHKRHKKISALYLNNKLITKPKKNDTD